MKVPLPYLIASAALCLWLGLFLREPSQPPVQAESLPSSGQLDELRRKDGHLVQPLLLADLRDDEPMLAPLKNMVEEYFRQKQQSGEIRMASVYFRDFNTSRSFTIHPSETYSPGSILKIPTLITYLKDAQANPGLMQKKIFFRKHFSVIPEQTRTGEMMQENRYYSVSDLIERMIVHSDNDATALLNQHINMDSFLALFRVLGLKRPDLKDWNYQITATECSRFMRILFYSTYLDEAHSELAMRLLTRTAFAEGFTHLLDSGLVVAHKFGERNLDNEQQLHETGIFYLGNEPYLLTVMTKGKDRKPLPGVLADISRMTWHYLKGTSS